MLNKIFDVYEGDKLIFSGNQTQIRTRFGLYKGISIHNYARKGIKLFRRYTIVDTEKVEEKKPKIIDKKELDYLLFHLEHYGNTITHKDLNDYVDILKNNGFNVRIIEHPKSGNERRWWYVERT